MELCRIPGSRWLPSLDDVNEAIEFFGARGYFSPPDTSYRHLSGEGSEKIEINLFCNLQNWLRVTSRLYISSLGEDFVNFEDCRRPLLQTIYVVILLNGLDEMSKWCHDLPRRCLETLLAHPTLVVLDEAR